jgi:Arc/MetJ-type ribon-helix-helix transcriptional regulator
MKVSVSLPGDDLAYLESQIANGRYATRSAAMHAAIKSLRTRDLEAQYAEAARDWAESGDQAAWGSTVADGLDDEAW